MRSSSRHLFRLAVLFEIASAEPNNRLSFLKHDNNQAKDFVGNHIDHVMERAYERASTPQEAGAAIKYAEQILVGLQAIPDITGLIPEGSEWFVDVSNNLLAIFKQKNNRLILVTFLNKQQVIPKTVSGDLKKELVRLKLKTKG